MVKTIIKTQPKSIVLENVKGLERKYVEVAGERISCLEYILRLLRRECPNYHFCVIPPAWTCPTSLGHRIRRPREYILGGRRDIFTAFPNEVAFGQEALRLFITLVRANATKMSSASGLDLPPPATTDPSSLEQKIFCVCSWRASCSQHPCQCGCRGNARSCAWRRRHKQAWSKLPRQSQNYSYFQELWDKYGIDADKVVTSPRERDLLNLRVAEHGGLEASRRAILDLSQSYGWDQWRSDGNIPTVATNSAVFLVGAGERMLITDLFKHMGFPDVHRYNEYPDHTLRMLLGNTMHVAVVGFALSVLLSM